MEMGEQSCAKKERKLGEESGKWNHNKLKNPQ